MDVFARFALPEDLSELERLYRLLEAEMDDYHPMWKRADGLDEPVHDQLSAWVESPTALAIVGGIDGVPLGMLLAREESMRTQARGERLGVIRFVFTEAPAREVGIGEAMLGLAIDELHARGIVRFDAHVLPGHRLVKNFFESGGFSARSIVMHHDPERR